MNEHLGQYPHEDAGGTTHEREWLTQKLQAAVRHLRDLEDYYRVQPNELAQLRADRARACHEVITVDFLRGNVNAPTLYEAAKALHEQVEMDEAAGICLSDRTASLALGARLHGSR